MPTVSAVIDEELHQRLTNWKLRTLHGSTSESVKILLTFGLDAEDKRLVDTRERYETEEAERV